MHDEGRIVYTAAGALFDEEGLYRWRLWRVWDESRPRILWVLLNPSTANAHRDDPTLRRCIGYASRWGYGGVEVVNLFALCSTSPRVLGVASDSVGDANDAHIVAAALAAGLVVCGWGAHPLAPARARLVVALLQDVGRSLHCIGLTKGGQPRHPLYAPVGAVAFSVAD